MAAEQITKKSGLDEILSGDPDQENIKKLSLLHKILGETGRSLNKSLKFILSAVTLGAFDATGSGNLPYFGAVGHTLSKIVPGSVQNVLPLFSANTFYEGTLVMMDAAFTMWSLYDPRWRKRRNMTNLLMTPAHAVGMDYSSAAIFAHNLNALPLNSADYTWRYITYGNTGWSHFINFINAPSHLIPGAIQGYDLAIYIAAGYFVLQGLISAVNYLKGKKTKNERG